MAEAENSGDTTGARNVKSDREQARARDTCHARQGTRTKLIESR